MRKALSNRLETIISMVSAGNRVCDVGCDHGYVSIELVKRGISPSALAMDINKGPLDRARENVKTEGLEDKITLILSDGLDKYVKGNADTLIIAGMGGHLMSDILLADMDKCSFKEMILSPQSEIPEFRHFLYQNGWMISDERMVHEDGKYYVILKAVPKDGVTNTTLSQKEAMLGPVLLRNKDSVLKEYVEYLISKNKKICEAVTNNTQSEYNIKRINELNGEIEILMEALVHLETDTLGELGAV